jgi:hypothetical protein
MNSKRFLSKNVRKYYGWKTKTKKSGRAAYSIDGKPIHFMVGQKAPMQPKKWKMHPSPMHYMPPEAIKSAQEVMDPKVLKQLEKKPAEEVVAGTSITHKLTSKHASNIMSSPGKKGARWIASTASIKLLEHAAREQGVEARIEWLSPQELLGRVPSTVSVSMPAAVQRKSQYDPESLAFSKKAMLEKRPLPIAFLDYTDRPDIHWPYPAHDLRHRTKAAQILGIKEVPCMVIGQKSITLDGRQT